MEEQHDEAKVEHLKHALASRRQLREAAIKFEHAALKPLFLLNGGGLIALLTLLGAKSADQFDQDWVIVSLIAWGFGLTFAGFATGFGYFSQFAFYKAHGDNVRLKFRFDEYISQEEDDDQTVPIRLTHTPTRDRLCA